MLARTVTRSAPPRPASFCIVRCMARTLDQVLVVQDSLARTVIKFVPPKPNFSYTAKCTSLHSCVASKEILEIPLTLVKTVIKSALLRPALYSTVRCTGDLAVSTSLKVTWSKNPSFVRSVILFAQPRPALSCIERCIGPHLAQGKALKMELCKALLLARTAIKSAPPRPAWFFIVGYTEHYLAVTKIQSPRLM